ncbi:GDSL esterase/lipase [Vitis vinifera]|uniref:GDSL esterase/lipase n=1 Tax=Vitis vinifera TaxID=29760 RepID=A0A438E685_VITVI|nr:GDSL esterase/lipase [Vitis vinifera]
MVYVTPLSSFSDEDMVQFQYRTVSKYIKKKEIKEIYGVMPSERENFNLSGPLHLTTVDWQQALWRWGRGGSRKNTHHQRSVAASLVQGVYILERDRQEKRQGSQALAPPWWEFFQFQIVLQLVDDADSCIFGAIYKFTPQASPGTLSTNESPHYVIAFRGTIRKPHSVSQDLKLDLQLLQNGLHRTSRFEIAMQAVRNMVAATQENNICETRDQNASSLITAGLAVAVKGTHQRNQFEDQFVALSTWVPSLFVNPADHICSEYIGYFKHRKKMKDIGAGGIERLATQNSIHGLFMTAIGKESEPPLHLIPSAVLTINSIPSPDFKHAHGIHQWWGPELYLKSKLYKYS